MGEAHPVPDEGGQVPDAGPFFDLSSEPMAILSRDGKWLRINAAFGDLFGWQEEEVQDQPVTRLVHPEDRDLLRRGLTGEESGEIGLHLLTAVGDFRGGRWRFVPAPTTGALLAVGHRASDRRDARFEAQIRQLTNEIEHRVRNNLAVIRSIIRRMGEGTSDTETFAHLQGRIDAISRVQSKLRFADDDARGVDLALLIEDELLAQSMHEGAQLTIEGPDIGLSGKTAEPFVLEIHELAMNAVKFGAFPVHEARVDVR